MQLKCFFLIVVFVNLTANAYSPQERSCLQESAESFSIDACLLQAVLDQEGGTPGVLTVHKNGSVDIGRGQINKGGAWARKLATLGISEEVLQHNPCVNILATAFILREERDLVRGNVALGIGNYHRGYSPVVTPLRAKYFLSVSKRYRKLINDGQCPT